MLGDYWSKAKADQELLQNKCANPHLRVWVNSLGGGNLEWKVVYKYPDRSGSETIFTQKADKMLDIEQAALAVYRNDTSKRENKNAVHRSFEELETKRKKGVAEANRQVIEGNYEISKVLRKEMLK